MLQDLSDDSPEYQSVFDEMQQTIREHKDGGAAGGIFKAYSVIKIQKVKNTKLWQRYERRFFIEYVAFIRFSIDIVTLVPLSGDPL